MAYLLVAILLLGINAFMVGAEVAITAAAGRRSVIESQAASGSFRARMATKGGRASILRRRRKGRARLTPV